MKIRLSKKLVFILGGALVLCGASGSAAVLIGTDKILGPSYKDINGLSCTTLETYKMRRGQSVWVRRYVTSDQSADGVARLKTALRVARAVQEREKAGLVQVAMIDTSGPKDSADMRGRAIAAQVVYIPDPSKIADGTQTQSYSGYYMDGAPNSKGEFYGMRVDLPLEDIEHMEASLTDKADCIDPTAAVAAEGGAAPKGDSKGGKKTPASHGASTEAEKPAGHGAASGADGAKAEEAAVKTEEVAAKESGGLLSSITGMVFGSKAEPAAADQNAQGAQSDTQQSGGNDAAVVNDHGAQSQTPGNAAAAPQPAADKSFFEQAKSMILGGSSETPAAPAQTEAKADAGHQMPPAAAPVEPALPPRTTAEGGKGWSKSDAANEIHSSGQPNPADGKPQAAADASHGSAPVGAKPADGGSNAADAAGAAWLEKFRAQQDAAAAAANGAKPTH
jgi:hypothetical protein